MGWFDQFGESLERQTTNPLFLGGAALLTGEGMTGAMRGMQMGNQMSQQRRQQAEQEAQKARWNEYASGNMGGLTPEMQALVRASGPQGMKLASEALMRAPELDIQRQRLRIEQQNAARQGALTAAQLQQLRMQTPQARAAIAPQFGIKPGTTEYNQFVLNGQFTPQNPADVAVANILSGAMPGATQPQPRYLPQSNEAPVGDPNVIRTQAAPQRQAEPQPDAGGMFSGMPVEQQRRVAEGLLLNPRTKALGEQLIKDIESKRLGKEARNEVEKKEFAASEGLARLQELKRLYRPEYQTIEGKFGMGWTAFVDRFKSARDRIPPQDLEQLERFSAFRSEAFDTINDYIKSVTGAAMTNAEAERILRGIPNPGVNWWEGDSPTQFKAKLDQAIRKTQLALMRTSYAKTQGRAWQTISIPQMERIIQQRGDQLFNEIRAQGVPQNEIQQQVKMRLRQEFGGNI